MTEQVLHSSSPDLINQDTNKPLGPREFVLRYLKYVPWIIICVAISLVLAYVRLRYETRIYNVKSSLLIKNDRSNIGDKDAKLDELFMAEPTVNLSNEVEILKSTPLIKRVVKDLNLQTLYYNKGNVRSTLVYNESPFRLEVIQPANPSKGLGFSMIIRDKDKFTLNKDKTPHYFGQPFNLGGNICVLLPNREFDLNRSQSLEYEVSMLPLLNAAEAIIGNLKVAQAADQATILSLSFETENIAMGQDVLNTMMAVYDSMIVEDKRRISASTLDFIDDRLESLKDSLGGVEGKLRVFLEKTQAFDIEGQSKAFIDRVSDATKIGGEHEVRTKVVDYLTDYISNTENMYKIVPTDLGIEEPSLIQLSAEYNALLLQREANLKTTTPNNPMIQGFDVSLNKIRSNIIQALKNVRNAYAIAGNKIAQVDQELQGQIKSLPGKSQQALTIQRNQKILEELYSFLLQKKLETSISSASTISNSRVLEPALGNTLPVKPNRSSLYLTYMLIGLVIPVGLISIFELLSDKVNNRLEIERATNAPILGEIGHSDDSATLVVTSNSRRFIAEQFRIIRTNLQYVIGRNPRPVILVTSSFSGEGKSFISTNMGAVMALSGKKTVIMEFDIRKPKILSSLDLKRKMGITNYIIGKASFDELPIPVEGTENLYVIACGPIPPNPSELLLSSRLEELMKQVKENFEVVIMDTAPVGLVSDAINLSRFADCTLYIVRRGHTVRRLLGLVQDLYVNKKLPSLSLLLNDVKLEGGYYGGYYGGYGYYGYGYGNEGGYFEEESRRKKSKIFRRLQRWWRQWFS